MMITVIDYFHMTLLMVSDHFQHYNFLRSCSLIIVISVLLSPFDNLFVAIAINVQIATITPQMSLTK